MKPVALSTPRLRLENAPDDEASIREMIGWLNNPLIVRYSEQRHRHHTIESQRDFIHSFWGEDLFLAIYQEKIMIGTVTIYTDIPNLVANVGIMVGDSSCWGRGMGFEAWSAACNWMLEGYFRKIEAGCMACNIPMMGICSHYGMTEEGRQEEHFLLHGTPTDLVHWGMIK